MIKICNDRGVFPNSVKISNQYENDTRSIDFDLSDVQFTGNTYLICKYQGQSTFYAPLLLDSNFSIPVETFLSAQPGAYTCVIVISTVTIDADYNFSSDNPLFVSNEFTLNVDPNFLTGTATAWELTPAAQNYFDQLIVLVDKVREDLDSGAFIGNGIKSITLISTVGLVDTYQILFTNGSTFDFQVTNGATPTITIQDGVWFVNGISTGVSALGQKGDKGDPGVGIVSIEKTSASGNVDTYTITFTNQTTSTFTVTNGKDGVTPNIQIGTVTTLPAGSQATATITGTPESPILNLGIPEGETGGTTNYNDLENKPQINGVELSGNQSGNDIGLVNNQQGTANAGKVLGIGQDGLVIPVENAGASDNIIYKDVPKQLNPNVTDSFQRAMWNLKMYGKSTQITTTGANLINEFKTGILTDNQGNLGSLTSIYKTLWLQLDVGSYTFGGNTKFRIVRICKDGGALKNKTDIIEANKPYNIEITQKNYLGISFRKEDNTAITDNDLFMLNKGNELLPYEPYSGGQPSPSPEYKQDVTAISQFSGQVDNGSEQSQPFTYTPTQNMYSTQDGSIADYVDVEKGVEVYQLKKVIFDGTNATFIRLNENNVYYTLLLNDAITPYESAYEYYIWCDKLKTYTSKTSIDSLDNSIRYGNGGGTSKALFLKIDDTITTVEQLNTWLQSNPITVVYVLQTPTEIPIDPEQLAMLRALYTYNGVTNFLCNAPVSFTYERSLQIVINNLENAIGQTNANILLNGGNN